MVGGACPASRVGKESMDPDTPIGMSATMSRGATTTVLGIMKEGGIHVGITRAFQRKRMVSTASGADPSGAVSLLSLDSHVPPLSAAMDS